jgi:pimeloyl-ACP methyl ester carboxylesterase
VRVLPRSFVAALSCVVAGALMAGCSGGSGVAPRTVSTAAPTTLAGYYGQKLHWTACDNGFECARLLVPFDYSRPAWKRFSLPVIKLPAADPRQRIGALVVNPGGPGGSGVQYAQQARSAISAPVLDRFDIVGFDPRGVGGSQPAVHCMSGPQLDTYYATDDTPATPAQLGRVVSQSELFARECASHAGSLLPYVGSQNAARDLDVLRAALGDAKLTYLGKSYGTYLGAWYAQLFPGHVRALVLDGALNPDATSTEINQVQAQGFEVALHAFAANCMATPGCPLGRGSDVAAGIAKIQSLLNHATATPLANDLGDGRPADGSLILEGIAAGLYSQSYWPVLRTGLADAFRGDGTVLLELADALLERNSSGHYTNLPDSNMAINCLDRPWPRNLAAWRSAARAAARAAPQFGAAIMWGSLPCAYWPVKPYPLPHITAAGAPPILVVGTTRDPATPYRWAQALAGELSSGVLLGWNGNGHTAYMMGSSCVDNYVNRYLITRAVPRSGTICP